MVNASADVVSACLFTLTPRLIWPDLGSAGARSIGDARTVLQKEGVPYAQGTICDVTILLLYITLQYCHMLVDGIPSRSQERMICSPRVSTWRQSVCAPRSHQRTLSSQTVSDTIHSKYRIWTEPYTTYRAQKNANSRINAQASAAEPLLAEVTGNLGKTGVPILDSLTVAAKGKDSLVSLAGQATLDTTILAVTPLILSYVITVLLQRSNKDDSSSHVVSTVLLSILKPVQRWLPVFVLVKYATIWFSVLHIVLKKTSPVIFGYKSFANNAYTLAQFFEDSGECILILLAFRIILNIKDTILTEIQFFSQKGSNKRGEVLGLSRFIDSIKSITSLAGWVIGGYYSLLAFGFNPVPIWTSLGASSIIIGLAAQPLLSNIVSGIAIYSSRVLVVGDHVQLLTSGGAVAIDGYVEVVSPTTCVIRDADDCLIYVNNKQMSSMILRNKSQTVVAR